jgi:ABC-type sulfate transport system substrate-binding protein
MDDASRNRTATTGIDNNNRELRVVYIGTQNPVTYRSDIVKAFVSAKIHHKFCDKTTKYCNIGELLLLRSGNSEILKKWENLLLAYLKIILPYAKGAGKIIICTGYNTRIK